MVTMTTSAIKGWHSYPPQQESHAQSTGRSSGRIKMELAVTRQARLYAHQIVALEAKGEDAAVRQAWKAYLRQFAGTGMYDSVRVAFWGAYMEW